MGLVDTWLRHPECHVHLLLPSVFHVYLAKCYLKVYINQVYCFVVVSVVCVYYLGKEIEQACQAATFVFEAVLSLQAGYSSPFV